MKDRVLSFLPTLGVRSIENERYRGANGRKKLHRNNLEFALQSRKIGLGFCWLFALLLEGEGQPFDEEWARPTSGLTGSPLLLGSGEQRWFFPYSASHEQAAFAVIAH